MHIGQDKKYPGKEKKLQEATATIVSLHTKLSGMHIPNERPMAGIRNAAAYLSGLKRQGVVFGAPDWIFYRPYPFFIELKAKGGALTKNEEAFLQDAISKGIPAFVVWNLDAFEQVIKLALTKTQEELWILSKKNL